MIRQVCLQVRTGHCGACLLSGAGRACPTGQQARDLLLAQLWIVLSPKLIGDQCLASESYGSQLFSYSS